MPGGRPRKGFSESKKSSQYSQIDQLSHNFPLEALLRAAKKSIDLKLNNQQNIDTEKYELINNIIKTIIENEEKNKDIISEKINECLKIKTKKVSEIKTVAMILYNHLSGKYVL